MENSFGPENPLPEMHMTLCIGYLDRQILEISTEYIIHCHGNDLYKIIANLKDKI